MKVGFSRIDITPPPGTRKVGWIQEIIGQRALDPLFARIAVFSSSFRIPTSDFRIAFVQLDVLSVTRSLVSHIRSRIEADYRFPAANIMVAATHNHAGPAVCNEGAVKRDETYVATLLDKVSQCFSQALANQGDAEIGFASGTNDLAHNRRVIYKDGFVRTHGKLSDKDAVGLEGIEDRQVNLMAVRSKGGKTLGALVNYACHPTHHGGDDVFSGGWPGTLERELQKQGFPHVLFLNGCAGNQHTIDPRTGKDQDLQICGQNLAETCFQLLSAMSDSSYRSDLPLSSRRKEIQLPFRATTPEEIEGTVPGAQRFVDPKLYDLGMPALLAKIRRLGTQPAEIQVFNFGETALVALPGEIFAEIGMEIKQKSSRPTWVIGYANGMIGYVPHEEAFKRGGYETTFGDGSMLAPEAGEILIKESPSN
jgi:hypothetical protein